MQEEGIRTSSHLSRHKGQLGVRSPVVKLKQHDMIANVESLDDAVVWQLIRTSCALP
jgi:hypothetical protein